MDMIYMRKDGVWKKEEGVWRGMEEEERLKVEDVEGGDMCELVSWNGDGESYSGVFALLDGRNGEDGSMEGLFEVLDIG